MLRLRWPLGAILDRTNILSTINRWIDTQSTSNTNRREIDERILKCFHLWPQLHKAEISVATQALWEMALTRSPITYIHYCLSTHVCQTADDNALHTVVDPMTTIPVLVSDLPDTVLRYIEVFLDNLDVCRLIETSRIYAFDWLHSDYSHTKYLQILKRNQSLNNVYQTWCDIFGIHRLGFYLLFDDRFMTDTDLNMLLYTYNVNYVSTNLLFTECSPPTVVIRLPNDLVLMICQLLDIVSYLLLANSCKWFWRKLRGKECIKLMQPINVLNFDEESLFLWNYGLSRLDLWSNIQILRNNMDGEGYLELESPFKHFTPNYLESYIGETFSLKGAININYPNLKIVVCDRTHNALNHHFEDLTTYPLSHYILYHNYEAVAPMHVRCDKFIAANGDIGVCHVIRLFETNQCKIITLWCNYMWNNAILDNKYMLPPDSAVLRDKHLIWIDAPQWSPLLRLCTFKFVTHCINRLTLVFKWSDCSSLICDFLEILIDTEYYPNLRNVVILCVVMPDASFQTKYNVFQKLWDWIGANYSRICRNSLYVSWSFGLYVRDNAVFFDLCEMFSGATLNLWRSNWLKTLNNTNKQDVKSVNMFVNEWNTFIETML